MTHKERSIRVLSVQHYPDFGGPHNEILKLESALNARGVQTVVAITDDLGDAALRLDGKVELYRLPLSRFRATKNPKVHLSTFGALSRDVVRLRRLIRENHIDVVKVHGPHNPQGAIAAHLEGKPIVWVLSSNTPSTWARSVGMTYVSRMADALLVNGPSLLSFYPHRAALLSRVHVFYPPIDTERFHPLDVNRREETRGLWNIPAGSPVVGTVASINPTKGIDLFVDMAARVHAQRPDTHFMIVGGRSATHQDYHRQVVAQAQRLSLGEQTLRFVGAREDVYSILPMWDVKVIASRSEGTTATAGEALASGVPVVAFDVGAVRDVVQHSVTGLLVPAKDTDALARSVLSLLGDVNARTTMAVEGRLKAQARYSIEECARTHRAAYIAAIESRAKRKSIA